MKAAAVKKTFKDISNRVAKLTTQEQAARKAALASSKIARKDANAESAANLFAENAATTVERAKFETRADGAKAKDDSKALKMTKADMRKSKAVATKVKEALAKALQIVVPIN